jgi:hypothetical protein
LSPGAATGIATGAAVLGLVFGAAANAINQQNQQGPAGTWGGHSNQPISPPSNMLARSGMQGNDDIGSDAVVGGSPRENDVWEALDDTIDKVGEHNRLNWEAIKGVDDTGKRGLGPSPAPHLSVDEQVAWKFQAIDKHLRDAKHYGDVISRLRQLYQQEARKGAKANKATLAGLGKAMNDNTKNLNKSLNQAQAASNSAWRLRSNQNQSGWINGTHHPEESNLLSNVDNNIRNMRNPF